MKYNSHNLDKLVSNQDQISTYKTFAKPIKANKNFKKSNNSQIRKTTNLLSDYIMKELNNGSFPQ